MHLNANQQKRGVSGCKFSGETDHFQCRAQAKIDVFPFAGGGHLFAPDLALSDLDFMLESQIQLPTFLGSPYEV